MPRFVPSFRSSRLSKRCKKVYSNTQHRLAKKLRKKHPAETPPAHGKCLLMALPAEIRLQILRQILCHDQPIQFKQDARFSWKDPKKYYGELKLDFTRWGNDKPDIAILATCRELYRVGCDIFYTQNVFGMTICVPDEHEDRVDFLGLGDLPQAFQKTPRLKTAPRLRLSLIMGEREHMWSRSYYSYDRSFLEPTIRYLRTVWWHEGHLDVVVQQPADSWQSEEDQGKLMLSALGLLRCKSIQFHGVPQEPAEALRKVIESQQKAADVYRSFEELRDYLVTAHRLDYDGLEALFGTRYAEVKAAALCQDANAFMQWRKKLITVSIEQATLDYQLMLQNSENMLEERLTALDGTGHVEEERAELAEHE